VPEGQPVTLPRLIAAAGMRWPVEESFEFGKDLFGLDQSQVRLYEAFLRHLVLVMAALAICAVRAATARQRTDSQAPPPTRPGQQPPADTGMIPPDHRRDQTPVERRHHSDTLTAARRPLVDLATTTPSPRPLVP
jgi:hypothetical protein